MVRHSERAFLGAISVLLVGLAVGLRQREEDEQLNADIGDEDWGVPVRPRRIHDFREEPSAFLEDEEEGCRNGYSKTSRKPLGEGVYGKVVEVTKDDEKFAMKIPKPLGIKENLHEMKVMKASDGCEHVLPMIKAKPCVDGKIEKNAFVTKLLPWDLEKWKAKEAKTLTARKKCFEIIRDAIMDGLECMHAGKYLHNDLKEDNVLFEDLDNDGCPIGLVLADFGMSAKIGSKTSLYENEDYEAAYHVPAGLFEGIDKELDTLNVNKGTYAIVTEELDFCAWAEMSWSLFKKRDVELQKKIGKGKCGMMGEGRKLSFP